MLTILKDPTGTLGVDRHPWDYTQSIQDNIARHLRHGGDAKVLINGLEVDPATDERMEACPSVADFVTVVRRPEGFDPITLAIIAVVVSLAVTYALMPKIPSQTGAGATGKDSPNNSLTAQTNRARAYQAIPDVFGYRRIWPDLIQPSTVEYIDHIKYVTEWLCLSRGAGVISEVNYAETPIGDVDGASFEVFPPALGGYPELSTTTLLDVLETFASDDVNGQEIPYATPYAKLTKMGAFAALDTESSFTASFSDSADFDQLKSLSPSGTAKVAFSYLTPDGEVFFDQQCAVQDFTVAGGTVTFLFSSSPWAGDQTGSELSFVITPDEQTLNPIGPFTLPLAGSQIRWNTVFLRGLKGSVSIRVEFWKIDTAGVEIAGTRQTEDCTYSADSFDQRFFTTQIEPSAGAGRYRVQFTRLVGQIDVQGNDIAKLDELFTVRTYDQKLLPGVTVIRVTTKATNEATGFSDRKFNVRWQRLVKTLDSDVLGPSRNFARAMAHIWRVSGSDMAELDTDKLAAINSEFGEDSPLLRFDASLDDDDMSLGERMQLAADAARCVVWRDGQKWTVTRDQARQYPELQFDYRNLDVKGESAIGYSAHLPASNDGVEVEYVDETTQAKKAYVRLNITSGAPVIGTSRNPKKIKMLACATTSQATNRAQLEARKLLFQRVSVTDTCMSEGASLGVGALVRWIDPNDFEADDDLNAGEVMAINGLTILTSEAVDFKGEASGRVMFTGASGERLGPPVVCTPAPGGFALASLPAGVYVADGQTRQLGSRYAFAVGFTAAELESSALYTATSIKPDSNGRFSLALAEYDPRIYGAD